MDPERGSGLPNRISSGSAVASAVGTPFVALFGPTAPKRHVAAVQNYAVIRKDLRCSPCYLRSCPIGHPCMKRIAPEEVMDRITGLILDPHEAAPLENAA